MKKRLPLLFSLLAVIALSASIAYWVLALYKPQQRPLAAIVEAPAPDPVPDAAGTLFGGQASSVVASNYQLTGVVAAGAEGVAILVADGQPARAVQVGKEVAAGVVLREVHPKYVMLADGGMLKRIELATDAKAGTSLALAPPTAIMNQGMQGQQPMPPQMPPPQQGVPEGTSVPVPPPAPNQPMEVPQALPPGVPPPPPPQSMNMPAPTRNMGGQGGQPPTQ
jgi:general secretion pathway protein C